MKNLYESTAFLDKNALDSYELSSQILMENAASAMQKFIESKISFGEKILILCGSGDNGGDGYTLARRMQGDFEVSILQVLEPKSKQCKIACECARKVGVRFLESSKNLRENFSVVIDCIFGSGFKGSLDSKIMEIIKKATNCSKLHIVCDMPSGLSLDSQVSLDSAFKAHFTICMGALKLAYFKDEAKDIVGQIIVANLGISNSKFEQPSKFKLLESSDCKLPFREKKATHKGNFGHLAIFCGEKAGASVIAAKSAFSFGAGLVSIITKQTQLFDFEIMQRDCVPENATALAFGMGLGIENSQNLLDSLFNTTLPCVLDADVFYAKNLKKFLSQDRQMVLTPHPKEFASLLKICNIDSKNSVFDSVLTFCKKYPHIVLLLKGANVIICQNDRLFINPLGNNALAKGGSGDVLAGMIGSLLAQRQNALDSTLNASLAHALAANKVIEKNNNYALSPTKLIKQISKLQIKEANG